MTLRATLQTTLRTTSDGVVYGVYGDPDGPPAPTLLVASATIDSSFEPWALQAGVLLGTMGYRCAAIDLPSHGSQVPGGGARDGLDGWADTVAAGGDPALEYAARISSVLDELIATRVAAPDRIAAVGTSRGGYLSLRLATVEPRVRCVAAYAPVTDLRALSEFGFESAATRAAPLALRNYVDALAATPVFVVIGDRDTRVDTDAAVEFARALSGTAETRDTDGLVSLHVLPEPRGHVTPAPAALLSAWWLDDVLLSDGGTVDGQGAAERAPELARLATLSPRRPA